jgi:hypothetical protein
VLAWSACSCWRENGKPVAELLTKIPYRGILPKLTARFGGNAMTMWYGGNGWGWCSTIAHIPSMVILWAVVFTAMILAVGFAIRQRNDPPAPTGTASVRPKAWRRPALVEAKRTMTIFTVD